MGLSPVLDPLRTRRGMLTLLISSSFLFLLFMIIAITITSFSIKAPMPWTQLVSFATLKAISQLITLDWVLLVAISTAGGLLVTQYFHRRCATPKTGVAGLTLGTFAATCPACLAPFFGIASAGTFLGTANYVLKIGALSLLLGGTYWIANKPQTCATDD